MVNRSLIKASFKGGRAYWALTVLLLATFLFGGGARDDISSLILLRPIAAVCLGLGLIGLTSEHWQSYRTPLLFMTALLLLILVHMIPLPPALWMMLPGRELAIEAGEAMGGAQPWRPLSLVPYRTENAFYAMLVPAAAMVLACQLNSDERRRTLYLFVGFGLACVLWGIAQSVSGFNRGLYLYAITNTGVPTGLIANRNHTAALLVLMLPMLALVAASASGSTKMMTRILCLALAGLFLLMDFATGSRGGLLFALIAIGGAILIWRNRQEEHRRVRRGAKDLRPYFAAVVSLLGMAGFAIIMSRAEALNRLVEPDASEQGRTLAWQTIVDFLPAYMPFGSGIGSFVEIFKVHEPGKMLELNYWNHAHNDWLEWTLEGGVLVIGLLLAAIVTFVVQTRSVLKQSRSGQFDSQLGLVGAIVVFVLGLWSLVDYPLRVPSLACIAAVSAIWMVVPRGSKTGNS